MGRPAVGAQIGLNQSLGIDQYGMLAAGDEVFVMAIAGTHSIEQSEQRAGAAVEAFHCCGIAGGNMWDEFRPAMRTAIEHARRFEIEAAAGIHPVEQAVPGQVERQRLGLIDKPGAGSEFHNSYGAQAAVRIGEAPAHTHHTVEIQPERHAESGEVGFESRANLAVLFDLECHGLAHEAVQNRIVVEQLLPPAVPQVVNECAVGAAAGTIRRPRGCECGEKNMAETAAENFHQSVTVVSGLRQHRSEGLGERQDIMLEIGGIQAAVLRLLKLDHIYTGAVAAPDRSVDNLRSSCTAGAWLELRSRCRYSLPVSPICPNM